MGVSRVPKNSGDVWTPPFGIGDVADPQETRSYPIYVILPNLVVLGQTTLEFWTTLGPRPIGVEVSLKHAFSRLTVPISVILRKTIGAK